MKDNEMYAANSDGDYKLVGPDDFVERRYYYIVPTDGAQPITGSSLFFEGDYLNALKAWSENNNDFMYYPKEQSSASARN